ncbi:MAG: hybrid sensor histidine kinase/response regulator [Desulfocapsa sp.]|nr:hybrid sensor histidine kinase/response regulator [Desulfocapsa sp.]MBN4058598.1 hybrid sensor histidine kinase/response regulator [Desulfocapsa sp. AH-315-J15]
MTIKVLIVDDEPINVKLIEEILEYTNDFQYRSVINGLHALAILDEYNPDIIILDIMMPGMSGYEVCRAIKKDKRHKLAKIIMVSGKAMIEERLEGYEAGADDYITKPFVDDELLAKLKVFSKLKKTEEIDELKTTILQLFSHETKTPLNGILLGSQLILDSPSVSTKVAEYAKLIKISGERIHDLVRKILLLSSLRNNVSLTIDRRPVLSYLQSVAKHINSSIENSCEVRINCPVDFDLDVDWKLFHEAFRAVVENGVKYSPPGELVEIAAILDDKNLTFKVVDKGPGISTEIKEKIFDEFYSHHIENHTKGTALSLAIAKEIMTLHQGQIRVESNPGEGANFIFTLPLALAHKN